MRLGPALLVTVVPTLALAQVVVPSERASAPPRTGAGVGLCSSLLPLSADSGVRTLSDAESALSRAQGGLVPLGAPLGTVNLHNGDPAAQSEFSDGGLPLPYSTLEGASPKGADPALALRLRGYLQVEKGDYTLAVVSSDAYSLRLAGLPLLSGAGGGGVLRDSRQLTFSAPGLYHVELSLLHKAGPAALTLALSEGNDAEVVASPQPLPLTYAPLSRPALHGALSGAATCAECSDDAACAAGTTCVDGLCQSCSAARCPPPCGSDADCPLDRVCDPRSSRCAVRPPLSYAGGCSAGRTPPDPPALLLLCALALLASRGLLPRLTLRQHPSVKHSPTQVGEGSRCGASHTQLVLREKPTAAPCSSEIAAYR